MTPQAFSKARDIADRLMTTCAPQELWEELDALSKDEFSALDTIAFECACCNHWFPVAKRHDDGNRYLCDDCKCSKHMTRNHG